MKTVRLSGSLLDDIRDNIKSAFDRVHPEREYPVDEGHDVLERHGIMEKIQKTKLSMSEIWQDPDLLKERELEKVKITCVVESNVDDDGEVQYDTQSYALNVSNVSVPAFLLGDSRWDTELTVTVEPTDPTFVKCQEVKMHNKSLEDKKWEQTYQFDQLIETHNITTLNQLLKSARWLEPHVPTDRLQKMNEKENRTERTQKATQFADDAMSDIRETMLEDKLTGDIFNE